MKCPACGYELAEKMKVCGRCGMKIGANVRASRNAGTVFSLENKLQPGAGGNSLYDKYFNL